MKQKNVYDELLSYKIPQDEVKTVAEAFIRIQDAGISMLLTDIISMHHKKADITAFAELAAESFSNGAEFPAEEFKRAKISRDEYINLLKGWIHAKKIELTATFDDLARLAKNKIDIVFLIDKYLEFRDIDSSISFSEFVLCKFCLFKTERLVSAFRKLRNTDDTLKLKPIFSLNYDPQILFSLMDLHEKAISIEKQLKIQQLFDLKIKGTDVDKLVKAVLRAKEFGVDVEWDTAVKIEQKTRNIDSVIEAELSPKAEIIKPVQTILKGGLELILKLKIRRKPNIANYLTGIYGDLLRAKIKDILKEEVAQYESVQDVYAHSTAIAEHVLERLNKLNSSYFITDFVIEDVEIGKNVKAEEELRELHDLRLIQEEKAALIEAQIRVSNAEKKLKETINSKHENHARESGGHETKPEGHHAEHHTVNTCLFE